MTGPSAGPAQPIGKYTAGCLAGGVSVNREHPGLAILRPQRNRYYGHPDVVEVMHHLGDLALEKGWDPVLVADMAQPRGGPMPSGHKSHQSGLDADIWFLGDQSPPYDAGWLAKPKAVSMVRPDKLQADLTLLTEERIQLLMATAAHARVQRIFVNAAIKKSLCLARDQGPDVAQRLGLTEQSLRKVRAWWGHDSHFHFRLSCPANAPDCVAQDPVPPGDGCDAGLEWWFNAENLSVVIGGYSGPRPNWPPELPVACAALRTAP